MSQESIGGQMYTFGYHYDHSGALISETYPSGRQINTAYDNAGRVSQVSGGYATQQTVYVSGFEYEPDGEPYWFHYGNNICRSFSYNSRLQITSSADSVIDGVAPNGATCFNAGEQALTMNYSWVDPANGKNNGNLWSVTAYHNGPTYPQALTFTDTYVYL